jgi:hypothetical protein
MLVWCGSWVGFLGRLSENCRGAFSLFVDETVLMICRDRCLGLARSARAFLYS